MRIVVWLGQIVICLALVISFEFPWGPLPALGPFFNPFQGFWQNAEPLKAKSPGPFQISGLESPVDIFVDQRGVPHVFARNEQDAYTAQGYVTARDRLWQMDILAREAAGRLAEVFGQELVDHDLMRRRFGLLNSAQKMAVSFENHAGTWKAVQAYCNGVNAYLSQLSPSDWPLEFKLLGYAPTPWTPEKMALVILSMRWTLSAGKKDQPLTATLGKYGPLFFQKFFPPHDWDIPPVIPKGTAWPFMEEMRIADSIRIVRMRDSLRPADSLPLEAKGDTLRPAQGPVYGPPLPDSSLLKQRSKPPSANHGSNQFVLGPSRTESGFAILGNDPHLDLTLPSTWYEIQLHTPALNISGVSLPGEPGVLIGFNDHLSWGITNGSDDVFDWYRIEFQDSTLGEYRYNGHWVKTHSRIDTIWVRNGKPVLDTVIETHHGPVVLRQPNRFAGRNVPLLHALRWLGHDSSDEIGPLLRMQGCESVTSARVALTGFSCPPLNFAFASTQGDIALVHQGHFPWKWETQGRLILDGGNPHHDWQGWVPWNRVPAIENPPESFVASANQEPTDSTFPYHLGSSFTNPDRARRLHQRLSGTYSATLDSAFAILHDDLGWNASVILPHLLSILDTTGFTSGQKKGWENLRTWDFHYRPDGVASTFFDMWWQALTEIIWGDDFNEDRDHYEWPTDAVTRAMILTDSSSNWFDDVRTPNRESLSDLVEASFRTAYAQLTQDHGLNPESWRWYLQHPVSIRHLLKLPAFGEEKLITGGCPDCIQAQRSNHGPSWQMVVEMSNPPRGFGIYPGGQSGNPGSRHYDDFVNDWAAGRKYPLFHWATPPTDASLIALTLRVLPQ